jgi:hypothetical protein
VYGPTGPVNNFSSISLEYVLFPTMTVVFFFKQSSLRQNKVHFYRIIMVSGKSLPIPVNNVTFKLLITLSFQKDIEIFSSCLLTM